MISSDEAVRLDQSDPLRNYRREFLLAEGTCYLDGNSLGPVSSRVAKGLQEVVSQQWQPDLIASWNKHGWIDLPLRIGDQLASILGAGSGQIVCCDSTSINLFKAIAAALSLSQGRAKVLTTADNFPTDRYMVEGLSKLMAGRCELVSCDEANILTSLNDEIAVLVLTQVNFRTGQLLDMKAITQAAHDLGILVVWDLAHSAGIVPIALDDCQVDFAVGCSYKFLNGGPGAPAFIYAANRHLGSLEQPLSGWLGHRKPFDFSPDYEAHEGIAQFLCGTQAVISMSAVEAALTLYDEVSVEQLREKSLALMDFFLNKLAQSSASSALQLVGPKELSQRGSQLAFEHDHAYGLCQALIKRGVVGDFRAPNILRFGFSPLYLSFQDMDFAVDQIVQSLIAGEATQAVNNQRSAVT
ncbi:MAG: kynureninase [Pseudomonadales bacterium]|jgi:kynureninase